MRSWFFLLSVPLAFAQESDTVSRKLETLRVTGSFQNAPLSEVVDWFRESTGLNVILAKDVDRTATVTLTMRDVRAKTFLNFAIGPNLGYVIRDGIVHIVPKEKAHGELKLEIYDVRSLCFTIRDFPGMEPEFGEEIACRFIGPPPEEQPGPGEVLEELVRVATGRKVWDDTPEAGVTLQNGLLIVRHTEEVHRRVRRLLLLLGA